MGFYCRPFGTSARRNIEEYDMGNIQHREEGWSRSTTTAVFPRANFSESKAIKESCLSLCALYKHITLCLPQTNLFYGLQGRQGRDVKKWDWKSKCPWTIFQIFVPTARTCISIASSNKTWNYLDHFSMSINWGCEANTTVGQHTPHLFTRHLGWSVIITQNQGIIRVGRAL